MSSARRYVARDRSRSPWNDARGVYKNRRSDVWRDPQVKRYGDKSASKIDDVINAPRSSYYFEHDDRVGESPPPPRRNSFDLSPPRRRYRPTDYPRPERRFETFGYKRSERFEANGREHGERYYPRNSTGRHYPKFTENLDTGRRYYPKSQNHRDPTESVWRHDKFNEVNDEKEEWRERR